MATAAGLKEIATYANGVGPEKILILPRDASNKNLQPSAFVADAHKAGLVVHPWTFRAENYFLPEDYRQGQSSDPTYLAQHGNLIAEVQAFMAAGVDGVFSDFPDIAVQARASR
jgi:glycerophosphoryl diester phosphodiesterase